MVCGRCRPDGCDDWVRRLRASLYRLIGRERLTVTVSGCLRTCPEDRVAVLLVSPSVGCREWALCPESAEQTRHITALLAHPAHGLPPEPRSGS